MHIRALDVSKHIRLAAAHRAGARPAQHFEVQERLRAVAPRDGEFWTDVLDVVWEKSGGHWSIVKRRIGLRFPRLALAITENRRAHAHEGCPLLDGDFVVPTHAHREMGER